MIKKALISTCILMQVTSTAFEDDFELLLESQSTPAPSWSGVYEANIVAIDGHDRAALGSNQFVRLESQSYLLQGEWVNHAQIDFDYVDNQSALSMFTPSPVVDRKLDATWQDEHSHHQWLGQLDWSYWQRRFSRSSLTLGRQPITIGLGRIFSPIDPLGAFNVFDLDRLYKSGVDAIKYDYFFPNTVQTQSVITVNNNGHVNLLQTLKGSLQQGVWLLTLANRESQQYASLSTQHFINWLNVDAYAEYLYGDLSQTSKQLFEQSSQQRTLLGLSRKLGANGMLTIEWTQQTLAADTASDYLLWQQRYAQSNISNLGIAKRYMAVSFTDEWSDLTRYELLAIQNLIDNHVNISAVITHSASDNLQIRLALAYTPQKGQRNSEFEQFSDLLQFGIRYYF
ncbi:hypothetical protein [Pseudoalteromonas sp. MMG012]|uniref:hypothetical protein n=1 Tax=Pseudoalteromonas sp. MMG012 TaxID=2822686 RepID=UPI001B3A2556|nr:hypothetical protein [Pseudoalteromonas sp. MMG012]MBQ4850435.1 hypothetical protein [Pseudoalteromonas sp. MMG012]